MEKSKLISLWRKLSVSERTRFGKFINSPFFNKHPAPIRLYEVLQTDYQAGWSKQQLSQKAFPQRVYDENWMNNMMSDLLQLLYQYLAQLQFEDKKHFKFQLLNEALQEREAMKDLAYGLRRFQQELQRSNKRSFEYYLALSRLEQQSDFFELSQQKRQFTPHLQQENDYLDVYYLCNKFRIACDMVSRQSIISATYDCSYLHELIAWYREREVWRENPILAVYYQALCMMQDRSDESHYLGLKKHLLKYAGLIPLDELRSLYTYALNYCIQKINTGKGSFYRETFELYQAMLESKTLFVNEHLSPWSYKNIVTTGIRLQEFEWTEQFIRRYKGALPERERGNALAYNLASIYFARGHYSKALRQLQNVEFTHQTYHLGAKIIQLKSYFELCEYEAFYSLIDAFRHYLRRNRSMSEYRIKANRQFLHYAKKIGQLADRRKTLSQRQLAERQLKLRTGISGSSEIANKEWLLEALQAIS